jgi:anti-sigma factor RsiW
MSSHPDDWIDLWIDGDLSDAQRRELELHWEQCGRCRRVRDALLATRRALDALPKDEAVPPGFEERLSAAFDAVDREISAQARGAALPTEAPAPPRRRRATRFLLPVAATLAALVGAGWWLTSRPPGPDPSTRVLDDAFGAYRELVATGVPADARTDDPQVIEARWRQGGITFPARVLDLEAMGIAVAGGDTSHLGEALAARTFYVGSAGRFICWMFEGEESALPRPAERRRHGGFLFRIYRRGEVTLVTWQEGSVTCALSGRGDPEAVIALAFAKAMAPPVGSDAPRGQ